MTMSEDGGLLQRAVDSKFEPVYASTYEEVKDALQDKHGQRGWIGAMAQQMAGSEGRSGKPYLAARRAVERHETGQYKNWKQDYGGKISEIGKSLPPIGKTLPGNKITLTVSGYQEGRGDRSFTATFKGPDAYTFANNPTYRAFFRGQGYPDHVINLLESGDYELTVNAVV